MKYKDYILQGEDIYWKGIKQHPYVMIRTEENRTTMKLQEFKEILKKERGDLTVEELINKLVGIERDPGYEVWKEIEEFPGYEISTHMNFKKDGKIFKPCRFKVNKKLTSDYTAIRIAGTSRTLWKLVCKILNPDALLDQIIVSYKDGNFRNCRYDNLSFKIKEEQVSSNNVYKNALEYLVKYNNEIRDKCKELEKQLNKKQDKYYNDYK